MYNYIFTEMKDGVGTLTINRPEMTNKLNVACMEEMCDALESFSRNRDCHVIVLAAVGEYFCNGGELGNFRIKTPEEIREFGDAFIKLHLKIHTLPKIVIAKVQGKVLGGGYSLLEVCDLAIASEDAVFGVPEMSTGLAPMMCLTGLMHTVTRKRLMELAMTGVPMSADEALSLGIINRMCPSRQLDSETMKYAASFKDNNPTSVAFTKKLFGSADGLRYEQQLEKGLDLLVSLLKSPNSYEVLNAQDEKRNPVWVY